MSLILNGPSLLRHVNMAYGLFDCLSVFFLSSFLSFFLSLLVCVELCVYVYARVCARAHARFVVIFLYECLSVCNYFLWFGFFV